MAANKRTEEQRELDLETEWRLRVMGKTQAEIAEIVGVSRSQVEYDLNELKGAARERLVDDVAAEQGAELATLDVIEREAWEEWLASKGKKRRKKVTTEGEVTESDGDKVEVTEWIDTGDPRYLATVLECRDRRCRILGLYAPTKVAPTNPDGTGPATMNVDLSDFSAEELNLLVRASRRAARASMIDPSGD